MCRHQPPGRYKSPGRVMLLPDSRVPLAPLVPLVSLALLPARMPEHPANNKSASMNDSLFMA